MDYISLTAELIEMIDEYAYLGFPLEPAEVRQIAFDFTNENDIVHFSEDLGTAGRSWFSYLLKRWPKLSVKGATNLSLQHAAASMKQSVMLWFEKFLSVLGQMGINSPDQIWNVDEHGTDHCITRKPVGFMQSCFLYWFPCGYLNNTWCPYGHQMASMWKPCGVLWKPHNIHF